MDDDEWYCGPVGDRRAYSVPDVTGFDGGQGRVVHAVRRTFEGDAVGYRGPVSLKLTTDRRPDRVRRLHARWARLAAIDHPNVARALEVFEGPGLFRRECPPVTDDVLYVAAVWVEGDCLRDLAPLGPRRGFAMARDVAAGITTLHANDLVHRDIHPGNVVIDDSGRAVVIDLGSARPDDGGMTTTAAGALGFIAPETTHTAGGPAADRWGLGMITVHALLGRPRGGLADDAFRSELRDALREVPRRDQAIDLLCAMIAPEPVDRPADALQWADDLTACLSRAQQRAGTGAQHRQRRVPVAVAAGVVLMAGAAVLAIDPFGPSASGGRASDPAPAIAGAPTAEVSPATTAAECDTPVEEALGASPALIAAVRRLAPDACAAAASETFNLAEVQPLVDGAGRPDGVVIVTPSGREVRLTETMWDSYRVIVTRDPSPQNIVNRGGYPSGVVHRTDPDAVVVELDRGGFLVGRREDTQLFWIPPPALGVWNERGGLTGDLGFPTSNPYLFQDELRFDFEHGYMSAPQEDVVGVLAGEPVENATVLTPTAAAEPLAGLDLEGRIVRQPGGASWLVDDEGTRHWIPDAATFRCNGGARAVAAEEVSGWAVATLPLGEPATCP
jgi:hypothetical protein